MTVPSAPPSAAAQPPRPLPPVLPRSTPPRLRYVLDHRWRCPGLSSFQGCSHHLTLMFARHSSMWSGRAFTFMTLFSRSLSSLSGWFSPSRSPGGWRRGQSPRTLPARLARLFLLFFLGLLANGLLDLNFPNLRILGVLQRIALPISSQPAGDELQVRGQAVATGLILLVIGPSWPGFRSGFGRGNFTNAGKPGCIHRSAFFTTSLLLLRLWRQ